MGLLWIVKLWWLLTIIGIVILFLSIFRNFSIFGIIIGAIVLFIGLLFKKVMASDTIKSRMNRNL